MKEKKLSEKQIDETSADLALRIALHCVRNTIIEKYHGEGKISDAEMMAFNKEVVNKIYTFLQIIRHPKFKKEESIAFKQFGNLPSFYHKPTNWDAPTLDKAVISAIKLLKEDSQG